MHVSCGSPTPNWNLSFGVLAGPKGPALQGERPGLHRSRLTEYDPGAAGAYFSNWILSDIASARLLQPDPIPYGARVSTASTSCSRPFSTLNASAISHVHGS